MKWAISEWHPMEFEEIKKYDKYIINIIESYFILRKYKLTNDGDAIDKNNNEYYHFESFGGVISRFYHEINSNNRNISLFSLIDFPNANWKYYSSVYTPSPKWAIGFLEKYIQVFDKHILPVIKTKNDSYEKILKKNQETYQEFKSNSVFPITGEMTEEWYLENNKKQMEAKYLSILPENKTEIKKKIKNLTTAST